MEESLCGDHVLNFVLSFSFQLQKGGGGGGGGGGEKSKRGRKGEELGRVERGQERGLLKNEIVISFRIYLQWS